MKKSWRTAALFLLPSALLYAGSQEAPVWVIQVPNPHEYSLFANGGWDGNWYVGYNNGWIKKLPPVPKGQYSRAFIGAKLGRMKTLPPVGKPPEFNPIPGEIWIALSSTPSWKANQRYRLTSTEDIPLEGSPEYALENVGESQWFWTEVPLEAVQFSADNYLALWSPTPAFVTVSSSPVLAAAWGNKDINSWIAKDLKGELPKNPEASLATGLSYFQPAMALKLIPPGGPNPPRVRIVSWAKGNPDHTKPVITGAVEGESIERVWLEYQVKSRSTGWTPIGRSLWKAPFVFSLEQSKLPHGKILLRMTAANLRGDRGASDAFEIEVSPLPNAK